LEPANGKAAKSPERIADPSHQAARRGAAGSWS